MKYQNLLFYLGRDWGINTGNKLAIKFKENFNSNLGGIFAKEKTKKYILKNYSNLYKKNYDIIEIVNNPEKFIKENIDLIPGGLDLEKICNDLNVSSIWPFTVLLRNHVRNFKKKFYYSFQQAVPDNEIIKLIKAFYLLCVKIEKELNPDLIILPNYVSCQHVIIDLYFKNKNKKTLSFSSVGLEKIGIFTNSYNDADCTFIKKLDKLNSNALNLNNDVQAKKLLDDTKNFLKSKVITKKNLNFIFFMKKIKQVLTRLKNLNFFCKNKNFETIDDHSFITLLRNIIVETYNLIKLKKYKFDEMPLNKKFIYFPLQSQPEQTVDSYAPNFSNQIETARIIAMNMPDDYTLVVKDHPNMRGLRSISYLDKIKYCPNIKLISYETPNYQILKNSKMLVGFAGSSFLEASIFKIPCILLGNLEIPTRLPNVYKCQNLEKFSFQVRDILKKNLDEDNQYDEQLLNYFKCVIDCGMDVENFWNLWSWNVNGNIDKLYNEILEELKNY